MSKKISYKGQLPPTTQEIIRLKTNNGKTGYRITKFQIISSAPGATANDELVMKIRLTEDANVGATINFTDSDLLAAAYYQDDTGGVSGSETIIFDNMVFNQDIYVTCADSAGGTKPGNYYIELEAMTLSDIETTKLTLQSIRTITSR